MDCKNALICALVICGAIYSHAAEWSYEGETGPESWLAVESWVCNGMSQSPIDIVPNAEKDFEPWLLEHYTNTALDGPRPASLNNNGHTVQINILPGVDRQYLVSGGGLPATFQAVQAHLHWGSDSTVGSEHTRNGVQYPAEFHVVHLDLINNNNDPYEALADPQGAAVLGFFIEEGEHNSAWDPIFDVIDQVIYPDSTVEFEAPFQLIDLMADNLDNFARYNGSLTTPGCGEIVVWTVFEDTVKLSPEQLEKLRALSFITEEEELEEGRKDPMVDNFRPVQPLNGRTLYAGRINYGPEAIVSSCSDRCAQLDLNMSYPCQCNAECVEYGDCCEDYKENCLVNSCSDRCGEFDLDTSYPCQCNAACVQYGDCCEDYKENCLVEVCSYVHTYKNKSRKQRRPEVDGGGDGVTR